MATIINSKPKAPTQKDNFSAIIAILSESNSPKAADLIKFCNDRIDKLTKKSTSATSKKSAEDEKFFDLIADVLADGERKRATEIFNVLAEDNNALTIQKVNAMLKKMVEAKRVTRTEEKKIAYFALDFGIEDAENDGE